MKTIVGIRFKKKKKIYSFDPVDMSLKKDDIVIVDTENGQAIGTVVLENRQIPDDKLPENLKTVIRCANDQDLQTETENIKFEEDAFSFCNERIKYRELPMKLVEVECLFDKSKVIFFFTADNRVDFRELVKDLVQKYKTRIELRQIWIRSEARICGGLGMCGREICCVSFLNNFEPVSIKMAKEQNMLLNPEKTSGLCGRLMCCLAFEYDTYLNAKKHLPKCGKSIQSPEGKGKIVRQNVLDEKVIVSLDDGREIEMSFSNKEENKN